MDEAQNLGHVRVALLHEADALRSPETRGGGLITLAPAFEFLEGPIWPHFGRPRSEIPVFFRRSCPRKRPGADVRRCFARRSQVINFVLGASRDALRS